MPKFSEFFKLNASQAQLDFVDVDTDQDLPVYVDPYAIEIRNDVWSGAASQDIRVFFKEVLDAIRNGDMRRARNLMSHLHEPMETFLGVSSGPPKGKGVGSAQSSKLIHAIRNSKAYQTGILSDLSEMALYVDGVDRDKISDLTTNVIRRRLIEYTAQQCGLYGIKLHDYNGPPIWRSDRKSWISEMVKLPRVSDAPVMLVPKFSVRRRLSLDADVFYKKQITDFLVAENLDANTSLVETLKSGKKWVPKGEVRKKNKKSKSFIADMVAKYPDLLDMYKKIAKETDMLVNFDDDDPTVGEVCAQLESKLLATPTGRKNANRYHSIAMGILTTCFYPHLVNPHKEWEINEGRKRIDIVYTNASENGFFSHRRDAKNTAATMVIVECKNYSKEINNPEIDQLLGRFDDNRGYLGVMTCRDLGKGRKAIKKCRDLAVARRGYIMVLTDNDLVQLLRAKAMMDEGAIEKILDSKFREIIS